ncbi:MAG: hypothetical protein J6T54_06220 [Fibrobacter sp.]|nr:hypothetical protein [Fibrobacter sp.]
MARPRKEIATTIMVEIMSLVTHLLGMTDEQIGVWIRKAVNDCLEGCVREDVDDLVRECYERSLEAMQKRQDINAQNYLAHHRKTKALCSSKPNTISTNDKTAEVTTPSAGGSCANPLATTSCRLKSTEKASKEGGDTREDSQDCKSGTPSLLPFTVTTTRNQLAGEIAPESQDKTSLPVSLAGNAPASTSGVKKPYGTSGHVMLTDEEGRHLRELYGENLRIAIDILDAYIENGGKAAKKYKNHAAVMRKGNWVWGKVQKMVLDEKRIANADRSGKSFKQMERDREANLMHSSLFAPSIDGTDNKRIANG